MINTQMQNEIEVFSTDRNVIAKVLKVNQENIVACGERLRQGKLVAFPTETVYGLGADATNEEAVLSIFEAKGRPLTDPVIVHIASDDMIDRIALPGKERDLLRFIGSKLWPGPLTIISPCNTDYIPLLVGSNTGTVGMRWPDNVIAQNLIKSADRPIAAPSANRFMHVSPTQFNHVFFDLYDKDIHILEGEQTVFGVESTVVRILLNQEGQLEVIILRPGSMELGQIQSALDSSDQYRQIKVKLQKKNTFATEEEASVAPGQLLKHYSPNVECKMVTQLLFGVDPDRTVSNLDLGSTAVIDFGGMVSGLKDRAAHYVDLSHNGDFKEAAFNLYLRLRECEIIDNISMILIAYKEDGYTEGSLGSTLFDKIFRSAAGATLYFKDGVLFN